MDRVSHLQKMAPLFLSLSYENDPGGLLMDT